MDAGVPVGASRGERKYRQVRAGKAAPPTGMYRGEGSPGLEELLLDCTSLVSREGLAAGTRSVRSASWLASPFSAEETRWAAAVVLSAALESCRAGGPPSAPPAPGVPPTVLEV